jgi:hypothetical protein
MSEMDALDGVVLLEGPSHVGSTSTSSSSSSSSSISFAAPRRTISFSCALDAHPLIFIYFY